MKWKTKSNILLFKFNKKEEVFSALSNLEQSWTGIVDIMFTNTFFMEAIQLVVNAIVLFEEGYFDCAFYSLRQSLEISTTAVYFIDENYNIDKERIKKWIREEEFPMYSQMIRELAKCSGNFSDMQRNMVSYFEDIKRIKKSLDKYVHKQGYDKFYVVINSPFNNKKGIKKEKVISDFELFLKKSIGAIAILRLSIDPLLVLLMNDEIYNRLPELLA